MSVGGLVIELISLGERMDRHWRRPKPESTAKLGELRDALGFRIPDRILECIGICAGVAWWNEPDSDKTEDETVSSPRLREADDERFDYGYVAFFTLEGIVEEYEGRRARAPESEPPATVVGPVRARYFDQRWIPIASGAGGSRFALDLNPAKGGVRGQVIWIDDETSTVRVVADSLEDFLAYGRESLRYQLGEVSILPRPPFRPKKTEAERDALLVDPECAHIVMLWNGIVRLAKSLPAPLEFPIEFHKPSKLEQIERLEKRFKTVFPKQLRCSLRTMGIAMNVWLQPGKFERRPIAIGLTPEVVAWNKMLHARLKNGDIIPTDLPNLTESLAFVTFAGASGFRETMIFYVVCSSEPHPLAGKVVLLHSLNAEEDTLTLYCDDLSSFLEGGLALMRNDPRLDGPKG